MLLAICILVVILLGLASRKYSFLFPAMFGKYPGDALWTVMVYWGWAFLKPAATPSRLVLYALATSYLDELSQLIQLPWLNTIRHTTVGHLVLGTVFSWHDMGAYTIGAFMGVLLDLLIFSLIQSRIKTAF